METEKHIKKVTKDRVFICEIPDHAEPVIFDSPHSGSIYPADFDYHCAPTDLEKLEDSYVEELFSDAPSYGSPLLQALFPRSYIDVNRAACDIDQTLMDTEWPEEHGKINPTSRSDSGMGLITRLIKPGLPIYDRSLTPEEIKSRIQNYYDPYHKQLETLLDQAYYDHGQFWHINCHSMPNSSAYPKKNFALIGVTPKASDIVLGDLDGRTCSVDFMHMLRDFWRDLGYRVTINDPFKGVELVSRYSQPTRGKNSVQIEINRNLYMNETTGAKTLEFEKVKSHCTKMVKACVNFAKANRINLAAD